MKLVPSGLPVGCIHFDFLGKLLTIYWLYVSKLYNCMHSICCIQDVVLSKVKAWNKVRADGDAASGCSHWSDACLPGIFLLLNVAEVIPTWCTTACSSRHIHHQVTFARVLITNCSWFIGSYTRFCMGVSISRLLWRCGLQTDPQSSSNSEKVIDWLSTIGSGPDLVQSMVYSNSDSKQSICALAF